MTAQKYIHFSNSLSSYLLMREKQTDITENMTMILTELNQHNSTKRTYPVVTNVCIFLYSFISLDLNFSPLKMSVLRRL